MSLCLFPNHFSHLLPCQKNEKHSQVSAQPGGFPEETFELQRWVPVSHPAGWMRMLFAESGHQSGISMGVILSMQNRWESLPYSQARFPTSPPPLLQMSDGWQFPLAFFSAMWGHFLRAAMANWTLTAFWLYEQLSRQSSALGLILFSFFQQKSSFLLHWISRSTFCSSLYLHIHLT